MIQIKEIINNPNTSFDSLMMCFEFVKENNDVVAIRLDGEMTVNQYTFFITFPGRNREMIRVDESNLKIAMIKILRLYIED